MEKRPDSLPEEAVAVFSDEQAWYYKMLPYKMDKDILWLYTAEGFSRMEGLEEIAVLFNHTVKTEELGVERLLPMMNRYYGHKGNKKAVIEEVGDDFLDCIIREAIFMEASDIHLEPEADAVRIRFRCDGLLRETYRIVLSRYPFLVNKVKIRSRLDIAEKRLPQDGRICFGHHGSKLDIRVSVLPVLYGEKIVLRLLGGSAAHLQLAHLGFSSRQLTFYREGIGSGYGMVLISGPTGSGKTTTLYGTLKELNKPGVNIITIEDPVEYTLSHINQVQVNERIGLSFPEALRSFLRQDPDIIMLGEIRDAATAQMAVRAALTGHLVLSTIHANSSWAALDRLIDMGVRPWLVSQTVKVSLAQRLVRLLCKECRQKSSFDEAMIPGDYKPAVTPDFHYMAVGCKVCGGTGYKGRKALMELLPLCRIENQDFVVGKEISSVERTQFIEGSLKTEAWQLFAAGETSLEEIAFILL
ncbi:MAG: GspE/PulE family protein [Bacteroidales bacterium]|nr:GspE/PulE family protein [Bacteroidales bacterium]